MSDNNSSLPLRSFAELKGKTFLIPYQQRGYKWTKANVEELLTDLRDFINCADVTKKMYCLQPLAVVDMGKEIYSVIDGQQRLTTLYLLYIYLHGYAPYTIEYERDASIGYHLSRTEFLSKIAFIDTVQATENIDFYYIHTAYYHIGTVFENWAKESCNNENKNDIDSKRVEIKTHFVEMLERRKDEKSVQLIWYEVSEKKQYETFRNLNSGKIHLTNTDLIKALLLNRVSGLPSFERIEAAAIFERMEMEMQNDHFWYMINGNELREGQTRMDFLFNLVSGCRQSNYEIDSRWSFRNYFASSDNGTLSDKWKRVRHTFLRLKDMYDDIYCYHYVGFLTYNSNSNPINSMRELLEQNRKCTHSQFVSKLKERIKRILSNNNHETITDYNYYSSKKDLRLLFLMHNIETVLQRFEQLHSNEQLELEKEYERFPFELLHKQKWDIEHISSNTDSDFRNPADRKDWLESIKQDLGANYPHETVTELEDKYRLSEKRDDFDKLYTTIMRCCDEHTEDAIKDDAPDGKDKMQVGNLTLLDSHTNRSYHNALFPRKRRYIIVTDGLVNKGNDFEKTLKQLYIPPCTRQVFTKAYNKSNKLSFNAWTQTDADMYVKDMEQKLSYYFNNKE